MHRQGHSSAFVDITNKARLCILHIDEILLLLVVVVVACILAYVCSMRRLSTVPQPEWQSFSLDLIMTASKDAKVSLDSPGPNDKEHLLQAGQKKTLKDVPVYYWFGDYYGTDWIYTEPGVKFDIDNANRTGMAGPAEFLPDLRNPCKNAFGELTSKSPLPWNIVNDYRFYGYFSKGI